MQVSPLGFPALSANAVNLQIQVQSFYPQPQGLPVYSQFVRCMRYHTETSFKSGQDQLPGVFGSGDGTRPLDVQTNHLTWRLCRAGPSTDRKLADCNSLSAS